MHPHYFGLMVVISKNRDGVYIICNLNGRLAHSPVTVFQIVPYFAQDNINLPDLEQHIDMSAARLRKLEDTSITDPDYPKLLEEQTYDIDTAEWPKGSDSKAEEVKET